MRVISKILDPDIKKGSLRIAFASSDGKTINEHFGWADTFMIYDVSEKEFHKVGRVKFLQEKEPIPCQPEDRHFSKINELNSCHIIYSQSIGGPAAARLTQNKIHPIVVRRNPTIERTLNELKTILKGPVLPPWIRRLIEQQESDSFDYA